MSVEVRIRRGASTDTPTAATYVGPDGEIIFDDELYALRLQDGTTPGGRIIFSSFGRAQYVIACSSGGVMSASQNLLFHRFPRPVTFPADFGAYVGGLSQAGGSANATGSTVIDVAKAANATPITFSSVGTITIAAGSVTPTFSTSALPVSYAQGDVLRLQAPVSPDATLADFYATLVGFLT